MADLVNLTDFPEDFEGEDTDTLKHMRIQQLVSRLCMLGRRASFVQK